VEDKSLLLLQITWLAQVLNSCVTLSRTQTHWWPTWGSTIFHRIISVLF